MALAKRLIRNANEGMRSSILQVVGRCVIYFVMDRQIDPLYSKDCWRKEDCVIERL